MQKLTFHFLGGYHDIKEPPPFIFTPCSQLLPTPLTAVTINMHVHVYSQPRGPFSDWFGSRASKGVTVETTGLCHICRDADVNIRRAL